MSSGANLSNGGPALIRRIGIGGSGLNVAVKDCLDIAGWPTVCGSRAFADADPASDHADVVKALLDAGCHIVGKSNMHELAYGVTGINDFTGTPLNPLYPDRIVGGSSSGSAAAVAAGLVDFAIGTDTGGSIRMPAACCGIFGLKPTFGAVSRKGALPAQSTLDCIGPIARDMAMITTAAGIVIPGFANCEAAERIRLARIACTADDDINAALDRVLEAADMIEVEPVQLPDLQAAFRAGITIMAGEMAELFGHLVGTGKLGEDIDARLKAAVATSAEDIASAQWVRADFTASVDEVLAGRDALVLPTLPCVPIKLEDAGDAAAAVRLTELVRPFNLSGHPAITLPTLTDAGLPAGVQLVGRHGGEAQLCAVATAMEPAL